MDIPRYSQHTNLLAGIRASSRLQMLPFDLYFLEMAEADFLDGRHMHTAAKSFFIRKAPFGGSFALLGGITAALRGIADWPLDHPEFRRAMFGMGYKREFIDFLVQRRRLQLRVYAPKEGTMFFPQEPIVTIYGWLPDIRLAEGILTEAMNFPSLSLTKWSRSVRTVSPGAMLEFARRRAQDAARTTLYAMLAGCKFTSNADMSWSFDFPVVGTMGHEWVQSYGESTAAFQAWLSHKPGKPVGIVDTTRCMAVDFPAWLAAVLERREAVKRANAPIWGWRNDSGDLAYLTIEQYIRFWKHPLSQDEWFADRMRIFLTNDLDEYKDYSIIQQVYAQARALGLDADDIVRRIVWAAGTQPGTCYDQPSIGGVMKLMEIDSEACMKLAFDANGQPGPKTSIPGFNRSAIIRNGNGEVQCLLIYPSDRYVVKNNGRMEDILGCCELGVLTACHPDNPGARIRIPDYHATDQQAMVYNTWDEDEGFTDEWDNPTIHSVPAYIKGQIDGLHWSVTRLDNPHTIKVSVTPDLFELRRDMIAQGVLRTDYLQED